jgi:hemerythrin superfamily protein
MTITQLIQNSPTKANELFAKLADTSDGAVKTREKLFAELKDELETLASLEEKHLFPVLRKHQETKDLVTEAINDNKEVRKLLTDLEKLSKTDPEFAPRLGELRKIFQRHVRDEKKELLPAVRKALNAEETQTIVEKIEAGRAEAVSEKKDEAKEGRAEAKSGNGTTAKPQPSKAEAKDSEAAPARQSDEDTSRKTTASRKADEATDAAAPARQTREAGGEVMDLSKTAQRSLRVVEAGVRQAEQAVPATTETARPIGQSIQPQSIQPMIRGFTAFSELPETSLSIARDVSQVWSDLVTKNLQTGARASQEMFRLTSPQQVVQAQSRIFVEVLQTWMDTGSRMMEISLRATRGMKSAVEEASTEVRKTTSTGR